MTKSRKAPHPHLEAHYRIVPREEMDFAVEVIIPDMNPTIVTGFPSKHRAAEWVAAHRQRVASGPLRLRHRRAPAAANEGQIASKRSARTILIVEDDEVFAYAAGKHLEQSGYSVVVATGTMGALNVLDGDCKIDLLLADIVMPEGQPHGLALARMARMKRGEIKTAFMTAYRDLGIDEDEMGCVLYKPLDLDHLAVTIGKIFASSEPP